MPRDPDTFPQRTKVGDTIPMVFGFDVDVTGVAFRFVHQAWGTIPIVGAGMAVEVPITEERAALAAGSYDYVLIANDGSVGAEQTVAEGSHVHTARRVSS